MWKVSWLYEKVHNIANFGGYAAILLSVLGVTRYLCNALRNIITFVVTK